MNFAVKPFASLIALTLTLTLAGCAAPPLPQMSVRAGMGSDVNLNTIRPPSGVTYSYAFEAEGIPAPVTLQLTSKRRSARVYDYNGTFALTIPEADNLEEITKQISQVFDVEGITGKGNQLFIPIKLRTDNRFRSVKSSLFFTTKIYAPHDCFAQLGICRFAISSKGQPTINLITETSEKNGVWRSTTRPDPDKSPRRGQRLREDAVYSIDRNAVIVDMVVTQSGIGRPSRMSFRRK